MSLFSCLIIVVAFFAGVLKSGFGIGAGIFLTPILALVTDPKEAVVLVAPMMLFTDITAVYQYWQRWSLRDILSLAPPCLLGVTAGVFLLNWLTPDLARRAIGLIGLLYVGTEILKIGFRIPSISPGLARSILMGDPKSTNPTNPIVQFVGCTPRVVTSPIRKHQLRVFGLAT